MTETAPPESSEPKADMSKASAINLASAGQHQLASPYLLNLGTRPEPKTISPFNITMDHDAIVCSMIDRLARGPDQDVHVRSVVGPKYPSRGVDVIYL